jgi:striatin 1/3/4
MASPIYPQGHQAQQAHQQAQHQHMNQMHAPGPQPMMREISHDGQVGGGYAQQQQQMQAGPVGTNLHQQQQQNQAQQPAAATAAPPAPPPMNLASVMHYLQSEWRRWERDRNEWEIERAEMRARIALLEGERRSAENLKMDMLRRVKMLEFALKQERGKSLASGAAGGAAAGGTIARGPQSAGAVLAGSNSFASMTPAKAAVALGLTASDSGGKKDAGGDSPRNTERAYCCLAIKRLADA